MSDTPPTTRSGPTELARHDLEGQFKAVARRVTFGRDGRFGWWAGLLKRQTPPLWDAWSCGHQHSTASEARSCMVELFDALKGISEPIYLRNDKRDRRSA